MVWCIRGSKSEFRDEEEDDEGNGAHDTEIRLDVGLPGMLSSRSRARLICLRHSDRTEAICDIILRSEQLISFSTPHTITIVTPIQKQTDTMFGVNKIRFVVIK